MTAETVGQQLRQAREARGLTIEQAARETHIRQRYLEAIEMDDYDALPSVVQARGFVRNYAEYLGLAAGPLLATQDQPAPAAAPAPEAPPAREQAPTEGFQPAGAAVFPAPPKTSPSAARGPQPSDQVFIEIGQELRRQRERLSLSLADIEKYTHMRVHYLTAMEAGRMEDMPSPVQARGMLSNYAHFLNLDGEALLTRFAEGLQQRRAERMAQEEAANPAAKPARGQRRTPSSEQAQEGKAPVVKVVSPLRRFLSMDLLLGSLLIVFLVGFAIWAAARVVAENGQTGATATLPIVGLGGLDDATPTGTPTAPGLVAAQPTPTQATLTPAAGELAPAASPAPLPEMEGAVQVVVTARGRAWMRVSADNKVVFEGRTQAGTAYPFSADRQVELRTGNAAALQVIYNQTDLGTLGSWSQVVHLIFAPEGVLTPTPLPTATPTRTPRPTP